jgi:hypothetical protein
MHSIGYKEFLMGYAGAFEYGATKLSGVRRFRFLSGASMSSIALHVRIAIRFFSLPYLPVFFNPITVEHLPHLALLRYFRSRK